MDITFSIVNQTITRTDQAAVVSGSRGYLFAVFDFSSDWDGLIKTAQFKRDGIVMDMLLVGDRCAVPWELLAKQGVIQVTVFGGNLITVNQAAIPVQPTGMSQANTPALLPTPNYYAQVVQALGVPGPQGPQGVQGIQGPQGPQGVPGSAVPIDDASSAADRVLSASYIKGQLSAIDSQLADIENVQLPLKANKMQEEWITPTLLNGWSHSVVGGTVGIRYRKDAFGRVWFRGKGIPGVINLAVFNLPIGYRPPVNIELFAGGNASKYCWGYVSITGDVVMWTIPTQWVSFENLSFATN